MAKDGAVVQSVLTCSMTTSTSAFDPQLTGTPDDLYYEDGVVLGAIHSSTLPDGTRALRIDEWSCEDPGKGHADRALRWLRERHDHITVNGAGELDEDGIGDIATLYWLRQREKGLVDIILLDDGTELAPAEPSPAPKARKPRP